MPQNLRLFHPGVSGMKNMFDKKVEEHKQAQLDNPFSEWEGAGRTRRLSKEDVGYGRPQPGSESERRGQAAQQHIMMEMKYLCDMIWDCAEWRSPDGRAAMTFGKLFNLYIGISDKVVGTLLRARKHGFVHFEGEMLYQRRDDNKVIELTRPYNTIRARFGKKPILTGGGEVEPWSNGEAEETISRRNSLPSAATRRPSTGPVPNQRRSSLQHAPATMALDKERSKSDDRLATSGEHVFVISGCEDGDEKDGGKDEGKDGEMKERDSHLLDPGMLHGRHRRARSLSPCFMDTILEDSSSATQGSNRASRRAENGDDENTSVAEDSNNTCVEDSEDATEGASIKRLEDSQEEPQTTEGEPDVA